VSASQTAAPNTLPPLSLYIHFPWCVKKCPYCDFNSHELTGEINETGYVGALLEDLRSQQMLRCEADQREIGSVFMGGGTPSLFSAESFERLIKQIGQIVRLAEDAEVTMEANPGAIEADRFRDYPLAGINRLSIGVQSFNDVQLAQLGRIHTGDDARRAINLALKSGFSSINLDLMHGLPDQTPEQAMADIEEALRTGVQHLSWYQLTIEPRTIFAKRPPILPSESLLEQIEANGLARLKSAGFTRYEISAYALPGHTCRHNLNYWRFGDYIGIGAGAHGKLTQPDSIIRTSKPRQPRLFLTNPSHSQSRNVDTEDILSEFMMNALRLIDGVPRSLLEERTQLSYAQISEKIASFKKLGLWHPEHIGLTTEGLRYLDSVVSEFLD